MSFVIPDRYAVVQEALRRRAMKAEAERNALHKALNGMMIFYGMDEDRDNGACAVVWDNARRAMEE